MIKSRRKISYIPLYFDFLYIFLRCRRNSYIKIFTLSLNTFFFFHKATGYNPPEQMNTPKDTKTRKAGNKRSNAREKQ